MKHFLLTYLRYNWKLLQSEVDFYPLRPELAEATYHLYRATRAPFYLHAGREILESLDRHMRTSCGFATLHSVKDRTLEDRMESFFLAETLKYLYLRDQKFQVVPELWKEIKKEFFFLQCLLLENF